MPEERYVSESAVFDCVERLLSLGDAEVMLAELTTATGVLVNADDLAQLIDCALAEGTPLDVAVARRVLAASNPEETKTDA